MDQQQPQQQQANPLEQFIANTVTLEDLFQIYNKYAPNLLTEEELERISGGNENAAKAHLLEVILTAARDGNLVRTGNFSTKIGMKELENIILDLQRDVKRVAKAISPQGAQEIVDKHNQANPKNLWSLDTSDRNKDGIPDVVIQNSRGESMYVNGYTTKRSNYPYAFAYYAQYPTRKDRSNYPLSQFKKDMWQTQYVEDGEDYHALGNVAYVKPELFNDENANLSGYAINEPKRMSPYTRYRKFFIGPLIAEAIRELAQSHIYVPKRYRLQFIASLCARLWETDLNARFYQRFGAVTKEAQTKVKKNYKGEIDNWVTSVIQQIHQDREFRNTVKNNIKQGFTEIVTAFHQMNPGINLQQMYQQDIANERLRQQQA